VSTNQELCQMHHGAITKGKLDLQIFMASSMAAAAKAC
jgi:hypothetical protein